MQTPLIYKLCFDGLLGLFVLPMMENRLSVTFIWDLSFTEWRGKQWQLGTLMKAAAWPHDAGFDRQAM